MSASEPAGELPQPEAAKPAPDAGAATCPYCLSGIAAGEATHACPACRSSYHCECWTENGGCAVYGCTQAPAVESRNAIEVPLSYWGQENKPCPSCGQQILAAAVRCRHCGATFASARPQEAAEFQSRVALDARMPEARRRVLIIFILSLIPLTAPIAAGWGLLWRRGHREELEALSPLYAALHKVGLIAALVLSVLLVVLTALYVAVRG